MRVMSIAAQGFLFSMILHGFSDLRQQVVVISAINPSLC